MLVKSDGRLGAEAHLAEPTISDFVGLLDQHVSKAVELHALTREPPASGLLHSHE
jgi:hypothetical protein